MLIEMYDWGLEPRSLQILFALALGLTFGVAAQISRFCLRRAVAGDPGERGTAGAVWATAFATAIIAFMIAQSAGLVAVEEHRFLSADVPVLAIVAGGLMFGAGMVLTRGCVSRLTVLSATGNVRAALVLLVFAIVAHASMKGVLAPVTTTLGSFTSELPVGSLGELPMGSAIFAALAAIMAGLLIHRFKPRLRDIGLGLMIGLIPVIGWATTSVLLFDEFDPLPLQSAAFTLPWSDTLFWIIASTAIPAGFGTGLIGGVLAGSFLSAAIRGELQVVSFESAGQTLRYVAGASLMGTGGVLAGGCTMGAGLSGAATLSVAALLALTAIVAGGLLAGGVLSTSTRAATA